MRGAAKDKSLRLADNLLPLLYELRRAFDGKSADGDEDSLVRRIIGYLNDHIADKVSPDGICARFYISKPQLCRVFKAATGSGVWEYLTAKRLIAARTLIRAGHAPTAIYSGCGFDDYSAFYKAYKRRFGCSPSETKRLF